MLKEFKEFAMRGNVLDLAVAVIIGAAFGGVVTSFVNDVIMPPIGLLTGGMDFKDQFIPLNQQSYPNLQAAKAAGAPVVAYGVFLNTVINFVIVAFAVFLLVKQANRLKKPGAAPVTSTMNPSTSIRCIERYNVPGPSLGAAPGMSPAARMIA